MDLNSKSKVSYLMTFSFHVFPKSLVYPNLLLVPANQHVESFSTSNALIEQSISNSLITWLSFSIDCENRLVIFKRKYINNNLFIFENDFI